MKTFGRRDLPDEAAPAADERPPPVAEPSARQTLSLRDRVLRQIDTAAATGLPSGALQREIEQLIHDIANEERLGLSAHEQSRLAEELAYDMTGYGPLEPLLRDDQVTDIMVNGPTNVFVERNGKLERSDVRFSDADHIATIAQKIAARIGRRIDESSPMVDARLPDGSRVNVILPPLAIDSPCISIRKFSQAAPRPGRDGRQRNDVAGVARLLEIAARAGLTC